MAYKTKSEKRAWRKGLLAVAADLSYSFHFRYTFKDVIFITAITVPDDR